MSVEVFDRVLVGVDGTDYGTEALRQSLALVREDTSIRAVTALDMLGVVQTGWGATRFAETFEAAAERARADAAEILGGRPDRIAALARGSAQAVLRQEIDTFRPTLLALGGRRRSRFLGALLGETASVLLHDASHSVLLARPQWGERWTPARIVVGIDGSEPSLAALAVADDLRERFGSDVTVVAATGGKKIAETGSWRQRATAGDARAPVDALTSRSRTADLVVVGARGLHGVRALGSVSERVAHAARSSVLVVRG